MDDKAKPGNHTFDEVVRVADDDPSGREVTPIRPARPPRIEEVARQAGVSPITVSRALRSPGIVSPKTRRKVLEIVERTGYSSNPHAVALRSGRSTIVAAFVSNLLSPQYSHAARACAEVLEQHGYQLMIGQTAYSYTRERAAIQSLRALRPAAVFFTGVIELEENRRILRDLGIPIVESWAYPRDPLDMLVGISNTDAGRMAAAHLHARGHRRFAYIGRSGGRGLLRFKGFQASAEDLGAEVAVTLRTDKVDGVADGRQAYLSLLESGRPFDAIFCANDLLAAGVLLEARQQGRRIPDDLAILALGDSELAAELTPSLSTICIDGRAIGARAGRLIVDRLEAGGEAAPVECLDLELTQREST